MLRGSTRRRRRSRSVSPGRSKRMKSRSRDRRGRDVAPVREFERPPPEMVDRRRVEKVGRGSRDEPRRVPRDREADRRANSLAQPGQNSLAISGGSMRGRERERDAHIREAAPPMQQQGFRGGDTPRNGNRSAAVEHMPQYSAHRGGPPVNDYGSARERDTDYGAPAPAYGSENGRGSGYPLAVMRDQRERERERELRDRERDRIQQRERAKQLEREKERQVLREREERARAREARAAADLRAAELLRRDTVRLRDEAALHARAGAGGGVALPLMPLAEGVPERDRDRVPRARTRERDRNRGRGGAKKGIYMDKKQVDELFLKVLKMMADDNCHYPCSASLINDRMKKESQDEYNVTNSEYQRFSNVLSRFEADSVVGTTKARDSLQVIWTKFSPRISTAPTTRRADERGERSARAAEQSVVAAAQRAPRIYFCGADEVAVGAEAAAEAAATKAHYMNVIGLLQERSEVVSSLLTQEEDEAAKSRRERSTAVTSTMASATTSAEEDKKRSSADKQAPVATVAAASSGENGERSTAAGTERVDVDSKQTAVKDGSGDSKNQMEAAGSGGAETDNGTGDDDTENLDEETAAAANDEEDRGKADGKESRTKNAVDSVGNGEDGGGSAQGNGLVVPAAGTLSAVTIEGPRDVEVYKREIALIRSTQGMVADVSKPSCGLGYKISCMVYHRCKPCLCLFKAGSEGAQGGPSLMLSPMIRGDRMLDVRDYKDSSEIPGIISEWFDKRYPNTTRNSGSRAGDQRPRRGRRDESPQRDGGDEAAVDGRSQDDRITNTRGESEGKEGNGHASDNDDNQLSVQGAGGGGGSAESVRSNSEDTHTEDEAHEEHEEVEDATGDHATGGGDGGGGRIGMDDDERDDDETAGDDAPQGGYGSEDGQTGGEGVEGEEEGDEDRRDDGSVGSMSSDEA